MTFKQVNVPTLLATVAVVVVLLKVPATKKHIL